MRLFRFVATLLLIAALPMYGWASITLPDACTADRTAMTTMSSGMESCCGDLEGNGTDSRCATSSQADLCNAGQACHTTVLCAAPLATVPQLANLSQEVGVYGFALHAKYSPPALWRPPRLL